MRAVNATTRERPERTPAEQTILRYAPDLPELAWEGIRRYVVSVLLDVDSNLSYPTEAILHAVAHHVDWCVNVASLPMKHDSLFRRDVIAAAVAVMPTTQWSTQGRRRSLLFRVSETLGVMTPPPPLPALAAALPTAPYSDSDVAEIRRWASIQPGENWRSARALVALGLGAGLPTRDIAEVVSADVRDGGSAVIVRGSKPRLVPVSDDWADDLREVAALPYDPCAPLFRPGAAWTKNLVTTFVERSMGSGLHPSTQRMRATWIVARLSTGEPMQELLHASGVASMDALVRYERFLPPPARVVREDTTR